MLTRSAGSALRDRILVRQPGLELLRSAKLLEQDALGEARRVQGVGGALPQSRAVCDDMLAAARDEIFSDPREYTRGASRKGGDPALDA